MYRPVLEKLLALNWSSLLDVGDGTGEMLRMLAAARPEARYSGIDISPKMVETAGKKLGGAADLQQGDAENLPFGDNSFDIVICNDSFHHYPDPGKALSEFMRVLRPGGTLLVSDYCIAFPLRLLMNLFIRHGHDGDVHIYSKGELSALTAGAGFSGIQYEKAGSRAFIRDSQRRIAGTCAGQGIGRKMGAAFKRDNPERLHFSDNLASAAQDSESTLGKRLPADRNMLGFPDNSL